MLNARTPFFVLSILDLIFSVVQASPQIMNVIKVIKNGSSSFTGVFSGNVLVTYR
jgi:hypothetical protein